MSVITVRKTGAAKYPWEARCRQHPQETTYLTDVGAVAFNTRGVGNRLWQLALLAAFEHHQKEHTPDEGSVSPQEAPASPHQG